jgi:tetratricopeptide (TPR) repeat protein
VSQSDFVSRGQALVAQGQFQEAVKVCRLGLLGRPTTVDGRIVLGQALLALKRYDEVLAEMRVALELDQTAVAAFVLKGEALLRKGDTAAAIETLHKARQVAPGDPKILQLLGQAEQLSVRGPLTASAAHPSVGFVGGGDTKHYPNHPAGEGEEDSGGGYTKPTSLSAPGAARRSAQRGAVAEPSATELEVGDKSGTVEVDPDLEGVEVDDDVDFDDLAAPPKPGALAKPAGKRSKARAGRVEETVHGKKSAQAKAVRTPTIELAGEDDDVELGETLLPHVRAPKRPLPGPNPALRDAVGMPAGPLEAPARGKPTSQPPRAKKPSAQPPPPLAPAVPLPPAPAPVPRIAAALPTMAALPPQPPPQPTMPGVSPASAAAAVRPTVAIQAPLTPAQQQTAAAVDALFGGQQQQAPAWAHATIAVQPGAMPAVVDPPPVVPAEPPPMVVQPPKPGMRRPRSKLQIAVWIVIGALVIGGGVFAGFQIRAMRLQKQIAVARDRATDLAKADTWTAWSSAAGNLGQIVGADGSIGNRAAFARARALVAYEFGDGEPEAQAAVDDLAGQGGSDGAIATAYLALAHGDVKAAKAAADAALSAAPDDAAAQYVAGRAALAGGDVKAALTYLESAFEKDARPLYGVGLARAQAASYAWDDASATIDRVLGAHPEHPAAVIERAHVLARSGRVAPGLAIGLELHAQVQNVIAEGGKAAADQPRGVSIAQIALANLALAEVDFGRGDVTSARGDLRAAAAVGFDSPRFAEDAIDALYGVNELAGALASAKRAIAAWPQLVPARIALAQILLGDGKPMEALDALKPPELATLPIALAVRGQARLAVGDTDGASGDFDVALKKLPKLEPALVGRAWLDLAAGKVDDARKLVAPRVPQSGAVSPAIATVYAAVLRAAGDAASLDKAKQLLDKVVGGPPGVEVVRAELELARLDRDLGDFRGAKAAFAEAVKSGNYDARLETALLMIEDRDAPGGRELLEQLYKEQGDHAAGNLVLELARARMLVGDHAGAKRLLDAADAMPSAPKWKLARERGRLAMREGDYAGAATAFGHALADCGGDAETFLLAADAVTGDAKAGAALSQQLEKLAPERLKGQPEASIMAGKLAIAAGKYDVAIAAFTSARDALVAAKASVRRQAQAHFGLAVARYYNSEDAAADNELALVLEQDPSLYAAYLFQATLMQDKHRKPAFELARKAVELDPDSLDGWTLVGTLATKLGDKKVAAQAQARLEALKK